MTETSRVLAVPPDPDRLEHELFTVMPLTPELVDLDLEAYLASPRVIATHSAGRWPVEGFTRENDLALLEQHAADHRAGRAFTYLLLDPAGKRSLGCVYLNPLRDYLVRVGAAAPTLTAYAAGRTAMVTFWIREDRDAELSAPVAAAVHDWLRSAWRLVGHLFRVLSDERASVAALGALGLEGLELALPAEPRPYRWFAG
ncbi:hypothetical protein AB3X52_10850 [Nocardioides sp. DS6]|uniref:N-acetyltransferase n=1 Tax=Nocardioides eburneus TaxID=3231482 RepID=A0ABV3T0E3_9ACTN